MFKHPTCKGQHTTVAEARACERGRQINYVDAGQPASARNPAPTHSSAQTAVLDRLRTQHTRNTVARVRPNPATEGQLRYLDILIERRDWTYQWDNTRNDESVLSLAVSRIVRDRLALTPLCFDEASEALTALKPMPNKAQSTPAPAADPRMTHDTTTATMRNLLKQVPDGRYAVTREGKVHFYVVKPAYAGSTMRVVREKATDNLHKMFRNAQMQALREILAFGLESAGMLYAETLSQCRRCGRDLTDTDNPYKPYGYGPDCGPKATG